MVNDDFDTLKLTLHSKQFSTQRINPMNLIAANIESEFLEIHPGSQVNLTANTLAQ